MIKRHPALRRISNTVLKVENPLDIDAKVYANEGVQIENAAVDELLNFLQVGGDLHGAGSLAQVVVTPDFHKGRGIPIGTVALINDAVLPQAIGNDIGCGVGFLITDLRREEVAPHIPTLVAKLRHIFFQGGRDIPMSPRQREALLLRGPMGLNETYEDNAGQGLWGYYDPDEQKKYLCNFLAEDTAKNVFSFADFISGSGGVSSRDAQIGSIGGGNHFVELQAIAQQLDGAKAHEWGLYTDYVGIMVHSGSVSLGYAVGSHFIDKARALWPKGVAKPKSGFYGLYGDMAEQYIDAMVNATNFAAGNRLFLGLMVVRALSEVLGRKIKHKLLWDSPHNWVEASSLGFAVHRKGACPALNGLPVLIPGSMGDSSFILKGCSNSDALHSACHGAGRASSRGKSKKATEEVKHLQVVSPIDPKSPQIKGRKDILKKYEQRLAEEAPSAYKPVLPIIETVSDAWIAKPVARVHPLLTIKG